MAIDDANTLSLFHFNSGFLDESGRSWTVTGIPVLSTAQAKFGGASAYFDGSAISLKTTNFLTSGGTFTIECWANFTNFSVNRVLCNCYDSGGGGSVLYASTSGQIVLIDGYAPGTSIASGAIFSPNTWYHIALVYTGGTNTKIYVSGNLVASGNITMPFYSYLHIGTNTITGNINTWRMYGYIDEFRVSNIARWTANFTPPTKPYGKRRITQVIGGL